ncbi:hypothetical protein PQC39_gp018 [Vibrio phage Vp_R1]|uniref:Uncharacterized protein n=1 Tax=Vibrio phage Vp_R1 TaxID=2059867 RepID=A0A2H5BPX4_9CAUD|nr:hypothetical protein PQC39_gp018 [Vibrio phage Vp_R1]AUG88382.1 hypothetical protein VPR_018 [Vibrio phage Vp_R1]
MEFFNQCPLCGNPLGNICPVTCVTFCDKCGTSEDNVEVGDMYD